MELLFRQFVFLKLDAPLRIIKIQHGVERVVIRTLRR
jgi:hypothetical protein